jgi:hypothetical protein
MNWQRDKGLIIVSVLALILGGTATYFAISFGSRFSEATQSLESKKRSIRGLAGEGIEPSNENLDTLKVNLEDVTKFKDEKIAWLRDRQVNPMDLQPIDFTGEVKKRVDGWEKLSDELSGKARTESADTNTSTTVVGQTEVEDRPQDFWGSFDSYGREGRPPEASHIPRLTIQLQTVDMLVDLLLRAKITELVSIDRDTDLDVEPAPERSSSAGDRDAEEGEEPELPLYETEAFTLNFRASETVVWNVLQALANADQHIATTKVLFRNENADLQPALDEKGPVVGAKKAPVRSSRRPIRGSSGATEVKDDPYAPKPVSAGLENIFATVDINVFRFPAPPVVESEEDANGESDGDVEASNPSEES